MDIMKANPNTTADTARLYCQNLRVSLGDWLKRPLDDVPRQGVKDRLNFPDQSSRRQGRLMTNYWCG